MKKFYLTTAIPYVNAAPHIGHALEFVQSDVIARYHRMLGEEVYFSSGSDENSLKNVQAAESEGLPIEQLIDKYAIRFENLKEALNISWDVFNRTSFKLHFQGVQKLWNLCKKDDIYKKKYKGLYCVGCEAFYTEKEIQNNTCPDGHKNIEEIEEENYFFKLSNYQKFLEEKITKDELKIFPQTRKNEVLSFIKQGLEDFSISRTKERAKGWGVPVPGDPDQVMYVWFDALTTYITALGYGNNEKTYEQYWVTNPNRLHVIGKGIVRFHAVYWPAMLASAGVPLPTIEFVHGYITVDGQKISKSLGNTISPYDIVDQFGQEAVRFYLLREIPAYGDGDFSIQRLKEIYNGELANGIGNLTARVAKLAAKAGVKLQKKKQYKFKPVVADNLDIYRFDHALIGLWEEIKEIDREINDKKPWELSANQLSDVITPICEKIREIGFNLQPFLPLAGAKILEQFNGEISQDESLFPRLV